VAGLTNSARRRAGRGLSDASRGLTSLDLGQCPRAPRVLADVLAQVMNADRSLSIAAALLSEGRVVERETVGPVAESFR
jgi:hypothetical protein